MSAMAVKQVVPTSRYFEAVMVEMVTLEELAVMDCLVLKDPKDLKESLVQQVDLQDLKASQELGEQLD
jgi:hypothetical protein